MAFSSRSEAYDLSLFEEELEEELPRAKSHNSIVYDLAEERRKRTKPRINPIKAFLTVSVASLVILALAAIIHGQAQLTELNQQISDSQQTLTDLQSYYTQLEMSVENKLGPSVIEEYAKNTLGMTKTESYQKEFISLSEGDRGVVAAEKKQNLFEMFINAVSEVWSDE